MISVGIERNVPIRSSATAIGHKHSKTIHYGQVSVERFQRYWISAVTYIGH